MGVGDVLRGESGCLFTSPWNKCARGETNKRQIFQEKDPRATLLKNVSPIRFEAGLLCWTQPAEIIACFPRLSGSDVGLGASLGDQRSSARLSASVGQRPHHLSLTRGILSRLFPARAPLFPGRPCTDPSFSWAWSQMKPFWLHQPLDKPLFQTLTRWHFSACQHLTVFLWSSAFPEMWSQAPKLFFVVVVVLKSEIFWRHFFIGVELLYNVVLASALRPYESATCTQISPPPWASLPRPVPPSPQSPELSSLCSPLALYVMHDSVYKSMRGLPC